MATGLVAKFRLAFDEASKQKLVDEAKQAGKATSTAYESTAGAGLQSFFTKIGGWLAAAFAVHKIVDFAQASIKAAQESETAWNELGFSLGKVGVNIDVVRGSLEKLGQRFLETTAFGDEEALRGLNSLVQITGDYNLSLHAIQVSADLAAAKHLSLEDASLLVGRALEGNTIQLKRMGVEIKNGLPLLGQLETMFGGAAQNELTTFAGKVKQLANFWQELKEEIGKALIAAGGGTSVFDTLIGAVKGATKWIKDNRDQVQQAGNALVNLASAITKLVIPALTELARFPKLLSASFDDLAVSLNTIAAVLLDIAAFKMAGEGHFFDMQRLHELAAGYRVAANEARALAAAKREEVDASRPGSPGASLRQGGSRPSAGSGPDFTASNADRIAGDKAAAEKAAAEWKKMIDDLRKDYEAAVRDGGQFALTVNEELDNDFKEKNKARLLEIRTQGAVRLAQLKETATNVIQIANEEAEANAKARQAQADADKAASDAATRATIQRLIDLDDEAQKVGAIATEALNLADAFGIVDEGLQNMLKSIEAIAAGIHDVVEGLQSGNVFQVAAGAGSVVENLLGAQPGGTHDTEFQLEKLRQAALAGDVKALRTLQIYGNLDPNVESPWNKQLNNQWGAVVAIQIAEAAKFAREVMDKQAAQKAGEQGKTDDAAKRAADQAARDEADRKAVEARAIEQQRHDFLGQTRENEEEGLRLRDLAEEKQAQQTLTESAKGLSEALKLLVAQAVAAQNAAELIGEKGPLGFDSPVFQDAKRRADKQFDDAQKAVAEALGIHAAGTDPNVEAGFTVQRTITETSAGRMIGELTTQSVWLEKIHGVLDKRLWPLPGMENGTPNGAGGITLNMDGQEVARIIGAHQAGNYQLRAELNGAAGMPSR